MPKNSNYQPMEELEVFKLFEALCDEIWETVSKFGWFAKVTVGRQLVRAADSVGANLVEGDGRWSDAEAIHFFYIARGSARETRYWINRCRKRRLIRDEVADGLIARIHKAAVLLNHLIAFRKTAKHPKHVSETRATYGTTAVDDPLTEYVD